VRRSPYANISIGISLQDLGLALCELLRNRSAASQISVFIRTVWRGGGECEYSEILKRGRRSLLREELRSLRSPLPTSG
jgi:hypothetical protein